MTHGTYPELLAAYAVLLEQRDMLLAELKNAGDALNRWGPAAGARALRIVDELTATEEPA